MIIFLLGCCSRYFRLLSYHFITHFCWLTTHSLIISCRCLFCFLGGIGSLIQSLWGHHLITIVLRHTTFGGNTAIVRLLLLGQLDAYRAISSALHLLLLLALCFITADLLLVFSLLYNLHEQLVILTSLFKLLGQLVFLLPQILSRLTVFYIIFAILFAFIDLLQKIGLIL